MPASVRNLTVVRDFELSLNSEVVNTATLVVIDRGARLVIPAGDVVTARRPGANKTAARRRMRPRVAYHPEPWHGCGNLYFCVYTGGDYGGIRTELYGPSYYGRGWFNFGSSSNNTHDSMVNHRDGDSLLADGYNGGGTRYCARQQSEDSTFSNNPLGNNQASSFALLGSTPDRC